MERILHAADYVPQTKLAAMIICVLGFDALWFDTYRSFRGVPNSVSMAQEWCLSANLCVITFQKTVIFSTSNITKRTTLTSSAPLSQNFVSNIQDLLIIAQIVLKVYCEVYII
jgi:hypothetical protein